VGEVPAGLAPAARAHNLPVSLTSFVGRTSESAKAAALLAGHRLVTVTGPGGSGKTRVAIEVARGLVPRFEDGVWLVELAQVEDPGLVPAAVAIVLGVREQPGLSLTESLAAVMGSRHVLLVLERIAKPARQEAWRASRSPFSVRRPARSATVWLPSGASEPGHRPTAAPRRRGS